MTRAVETTATEVSLFYPSNDSIAEEKLAVLETDSLPLVTLRELFKADPQDPKLKVTLPATTVRSVEVTDGVAWVDFDRSVLITGETKTTQRTVLAAIIYTLKQFKGVEKVAFTVEGKTSGTIDGKDVRSFWGDVTLDEMPWSMESEVDGQGAK